MIVVSGCKQLLEGPVVSLSAVEGKLSKALLYPLGAPCAGLLAMLYLFLVIFKICVCVCVDVYIRTHTYTDTSIKCRHTPFVHYNTKVLHLFNL